MNITWHAESTFCDKNKVFEKFDYNTYLKTIEEYNYLSSDEKNNYKGAYEYYCKKYNSSLTELNKRYISIISEETERLGSSAVPELLKIDTLVDGNIIIELLQSLENELYIKETYRHKKCRAFKGINTSTTNSLLECMKQGRSLLLAGKKADIIAKPLIDFYAASAYAYALIVIYSPLHKSLDSLKGSHGHTYNHCNSTIDFGGEIPSGTFLDLINAFSVASIHYGNIDLKYSLVDSIDYIQQHSISISLSALLSMVPELSSYYEPLKLNKTVHRMSIDSGNNNSNVTYNFYIGDGIVKPSVDKIEKCFPNSIIEDNYGGIKVSVNSDHLHNIMPIIYKDIRGQLWYVESPIDGLYIPEICLHYLIISALCNIMRYSPHEWSEILGNKISPQFSLLINRYMGLFEMKFPILLSELLTNYNIIMADRGE